MLSMNHSSHIPADEPEPESFPLPDISPASSNLVVVDDEPYLCSVISEFLAGLRGIEVTSFTDPVLAAEHIRTHDTDVVITDLVIGETSGVDILETTLASHPDAIVVLMTAYPTVKTAISVLQKGGYDYLVKPFKLERLKTVVVRGLETLNVRRENIRLKDEIGLLKVSSALLSDSGISNTLNHVKDAALRDLGALAVGLTLDTGSQRIDSLSSFQYGTNDPALTADLNIREFLGNKPSAVSTENQYRRVVRPRTVAGIRRTEVSLPLHSGRDFYGWLNVLFGRACYDADLRFIELLSSSASSAISHTLLGERLNESNLNALRALANAIEARDRYTGGHTDRVCEMAVLIAREIGWSEEKILELRQGCTLHDIGKIGVPDAILNKNGPLDDYERNIMQKHPEMGVRIIEGIDFLKSASPYILFHHERYDGHGYPMGLAGEEIPIEGRILAVVDTFDAIVSDRPYRRGADPARAIREIEEHSGTQFDPDLARVFLRIFRENPDDVLKLYQDKRAGLRVRDIINEF
jgi:HD-GYP domain-containing protein (c-di-GMP phosphodiesterase class II)/FixJ family two-component response regulator